MAKGGREGAFFVGYDSHIRVNKNAVPRNIITYSPTSCSIFTSYLNFRYVLHLVIKRHLNIVPEVEILNVNRPSNTKKL